MKCISQCSQSNDSQENVKLHREFTKYEGATVNNYISYSGWGVFYIWPYDEICCHTGMTGRERILSKALIVTIILKK